MDLLCLLIRSKKKVEGFNRLKKCCRIKYNIALRRYTLSNKLLHWNFKIESLKFNFSAEISLDSKVSVSHTPTGYYLPELSQKETV